MEKVFPVGYHTSILPSLLLVFDIVIPKAIIIVIVVNRELTGFNTSEEIGRNMSFDLMNFWIFQDWEICEALSCSRFDLILIDVHIVNLDFLYLLHSVVVIKNLQCGLHWANFFFLIILHTGLDNSLNLFLYILLFCSFFL